MNYPGWVFLRYLRYLLWIIFLSPFSCLWTPLSLIKGPNGRPIDVGRQRGENKENTALLLACQDGRRDPREHFPMIDEAVKGIIGAIEFVNGEPIESRTWGRWVPRQLFAAQAPKLPRLDKSLRVFFKREQRTWTVRGGHVGGVVVGPLVRFPVYFQVGELWEFEGCKLKAFFDPYDEPVLGTLVLQEDWRGHKPGHVIAREVPALDLPPQVVLAADGWRDKDAHSLAIRKAMAKAVRTETWTWLGGRTSQARDGLGNQSRVNLQRDGGGNVVRIEKSGHQAAGRPELSLPAPRLPATRSISAAPSAGAWAKRRARLAAEAEAAKALEQEQTEQTEKP